LLAAADRMNHAVRLHLITPGRVGANGFVVTVTWGVAPCWYEGAPLALTKFAHLTGDARSRLAKGQRPD